MASKRELRDEVERLTTRRKYDAEVIELQLGYIQSAKRDADMYRQSRTAVLAHNSALIEDRAHLRREAVGLKRQRDAAVDDLCRALATIKRVREALR